MLPVADRFSVFKHQLNEELIELQGSLIQKLSNSTVAIELQLAQQLTNNPQANWVELLEHQVSPSFNTLINRLNHVEAALCQFDIGQYGYCADCEELIETTRLENDPTEQRCRACANKLA